MCIHSGGAAGGHYYAYCKSFEDKKWYEFNDSTVSAISERDVEKAFGGATTSYTGYSTMSSSSAYMLMYRRVDPNLNIVQVERNHVPTYIEEDLRREKEEKEAAEEKKRLEAEAKRQAAVRWS